MNGAAKCRKSLARPLHDLPDGRGRGVATDIRRHPVADRSAAGTARASMRSAGAQMRETTAEVRLQSRLSARESRFHHLFGGSGAALDHSFGG